jgi:flagellar hook-length control protein FliK
LATEASLNPFLIVPKQLVSPDSHVVPVELKHAEPDAAFVTKAFTATANSSQAAGPVKFPPVGYGIPTSAVNAVPKTLFSALDKQHPENPDRTSSATSLASRIATSQAKETPEGVQTPAVAERVQPDGQADKGPTFLPSDSQNKGPVATTPVAIVQTEVRKTAETAFLPQFLQLADAVQPRYGSGEFAKDTQSDSGSSREGKSDRALPIADHEHDHLPKISIESNDEGQPAHLRLPAVAMEARGDATKRGEEPAVTQRREQGPLSVELSTAGSAQSGESSRESSLHVRLAADELGDVQIHVTGSLHTVSAKLVVNQEVTRQLLENHAASLRQRLADSGIQLGGYEVFRRSSGGGEEQHKQDDAQSGLKRRAEGLDSVKPPAATRRIAAPMRLGSINVLA